MFCNHTDQPWFRVCWDHTWVWILGGEDNWRQTKVWLPNWSCPSLSLLIKKALKKHTHNKMPVFQWTSSTSKMSSQINYLIMILTTLYPQMSPSFDSNLYIYLSLKLKSISLLRFFICLLLFCVCALFNFVFTGVDGRNLTPCRTMVCAGFYLFS